MNKRMWHLADLPSLPLLKNSSFNYLFGRNRLANLYDEKTKAMQRPRTERRIPKESSVVSRATDTIAARDRAKAEPTM